MSQEFDTKCSRLSANIIATAKKRFRKEHVFAEEDKLQTGIIKMPLPKFMRSTSEAASTSRSGGGSMLSQPQQPNSRSNKSSGNESHSSDVPEVTTAAAATAFVRSKSSGASSSVQQEKVLEEAAGDEVVVVDSPRVRRAQRHVSVGRSGRVKQKNKRKQLADNPNFGIGGEGGDQGEVLSPAATGSGLDVNPTGVDANVDNHNTGSGNNNDTTSTALHHQLHTMASAASTSSASAVKDDDSSAGYARFAVPAGSIVVGSGSPHGSTAIRRVAAV